MPELTIHGPDEISPSINTVKPDEYQEYLRFLATPPKKRDFPSEEEFAKSLGMSRATLYKWRQKPGFVKDMFEAAKRYLAANSGEAVAAIIENIEDPRMVKELREFIKDAAPAVQVINIESMTVNDLDFQIDVLLDATTNNPPDDT